MREPLNYRDKEPKEGLNMKDTNTTRIDSITKEVSELLESSVLTDDIEKIEKMDSKFETLTQKERRAVVKGVRNIKWEFKDIGAPLDSWNTAFRKLIKRVDEKYNIKQYIEKANEDKESLEKLNKEREESDIHLYKSKKITDPEMYLSENRELFTLVPTEFAELPQGTKIQKQLLRLKEIHLGSPVFEKKYFEDRITVLDIMKHFPEFKTAEEMILSSILNKKRYNGKFDELCDRKVDYKHYLKDSNERESEFLKNDQEEIKKILKNILEVADTCTVEEKVDLYKEMKGIDSNYKYSFPTEQNYIYYLLEYLNKNKDFSNLLASV